MIHDKIRKKQRLDSLSKACANAQSDDFKGLWFNKLIELAREYKMVDDDMRKLVH